MSLRAGLNHRPPAGEGTRLLPIFAHGQNEKPSASD